MHLKPTLNYVERMSSPPPPSPSPPPASFQNDLLTDEILQWQLTSPIEWQPLEEEAPFHYSIFEDETMQHLICRNPQTDVQFISVENVCVPKIFVENVDD